MPNKDDEHTLERLCDLLGPEENLQAARKDLFGTVTRATVDIDPQEHNPGFGLNAFERLLTPALPKKHEHLCLIQVREYALEAHADQPCRHTNAPCWTHLAAVAGLVSTCKRNTPRTIALAWLHHTVADTAITLRDIERQFGDSIADGVRCLTGSSNPLINAEARQQRDRQRLAKGDADVHTVKLADIAVNLATIAQHDPQLEHSDYLEQKRLEMGILTQGDEGLKQLVRRLWSAARKKATP